MKGYNINIMRRIALLIIIGMILLLNTSCRDTIPPDPPINISYSIGVNINTIYISWEPAPDTTEEVFYLVNFGDEYWNYNGPNTSATAYFNRRIGVHLIQIKAVDKAGNESEPAQLEFEYGE